MLANPINFGIKCAKCIASCMNKEAAPCLLLLAVAMLMLKDQHDIYRTYNQLAPCKMMLEVSNDHYIEAVACHGCGLQSELCINCRLKLHSERIRRICIVRYVTACGMHHGILIETPPSHDRV
jgi:hypothetical protein